MVENFDKIVNVFSSHSNVVVHPTYHNLVSVSCLLLQNVQPAANVWLELRNCSAITSASRRDSVNTIVSSADVSKGYWISPFSAHRQRAAHCQRKDDQESEGLQWLFLQNVIQVQPHGGKTPIVLYQEMWLQMLLHFNMQPPCNGSTPCNVRIYSRNSSDGS